MPELWQHVLRTPDGDATFDRMSYSEEVTEYDVDERRPPFSESPFFLGTGLPKPIEVTFKIRLRGATMGDADQELSNLLYVLQNTTDWIYQGRIATARWTGAHNIQPTLLGYIVTFNLTLGDVAAFDGEFTEIDDPPVEVLPVDCGSDFSEYATQLEFDNAWSYFPASAEFTLNAANDTVRFEMPSNGSGYLYPANCPETFRADGSFSVEFEINTYGSFAYYVEFYLRMPTGPLGFQTTDDYIHVQFAHAVIADDITVKQKLSGVLTTLEFDRNSFSTTIQTRYILACDLVGDSLTVSFTRVSDSVVLYDSGAITVGHLDAGYSNLGLRTRAAADEWTDIYNLSMADYVENEAPPPVSDPDPTPVGGLVLAMPALGDFQARAGAGASKVAYSQFSRVVQALNRTFDAGSPSNFNHPSIGSFSIRQSGADKLYFMCFTEIFEVTNAASLTIVSRGSNGLGVSTYDRNFQWSRVTNNQYYAVRNGDLLRFTVGSLTPTTLCSRARVLAELGLSAFDSQAVRWGGPGEMTIVSNADGLGKEMAFGYVRTGASALTVFAYNVTDDDILGTVQNITFTTEAELYFDYIGVSVQGDYGIMKPRPQSSSLNVRYWIFPLTLSGVGSRILGASSISTGHASFGLTKSGSTYIDGFYTFTDENFNLLDLSDGTVALNKAIEGQWSQHIGHVYWTHGFVSYDSSGRAAFEFSDGSGGYGLGDGWDTQGYIQMYYDEPTGDVFVMGRRNGLPEIRYWDA